MGSPWDARAGDALIVQNDEPREALALLATLGRLDQLRSSLFQIDDHHDITIEVIVDEVYREFDVTSSLRASQASLIIEKNTLK